MTGGAQVNAAVDMMEEPIGQHGHRRTEQRWVEPATDALAGSRALRLRRSPPIPVKPRDRLGATCAEAATGHGQQITGMVEISDEEEVIGEQLVGWRLTSGKARWALEAMTRSDPAQAPWLDLT